MRATEADEEGADDRGHDAGAADDQRQHHEVRRAALQKQRREHHGGADGDDIGLEQVGRHAGAVTDIVADIVGDHRRVAGIVLGDPGFHLAHEVGTDIGALGEDAAAQAREDRDQRRAEAERHESVDHRAVGERKSHDLREEGEIARYRKKSEAGDQHAGHGAGAKGDRQTALQAVARAFRGAHIGAHRDQHADIAGRARENGAEHEADRCPALQEEEEQRRDDDTDHGDGAILAVEISAGSYLNMAGDFLHAFGPRTRGQHRPGCPDAIEDGEQPRSDGSIGWKHGRVSPLKIFD